MSESGSLKTPLYDSHVALGGRMVPFAGYLLPVRYGELREEHEVVRQKAGLFDVSHMGEFLFEGPQAEACLQYLTCNDVSRLYDGKAQYSAFLNSEGGVIDDVIVYRFSPERFLLCVNAANTEKDLQWCREHIGKFDLQFSNVSSSYGQIALQGPRAETILGKLSGIPERPDSLAYFHMNEIESDYGRVIVARTGYTGEDGFEIFVPTEHTTQLWNDLLEAGNSEGILPCGLGARDTLRLEACYPLHGHELRDDVPALESGLGWIIKPGKGDFIGRQAVVALKEQGVERSLVGFFVEGSGIVREAITICTPDGEKIGITTSGTVTPTVGRALGLAILPTEYATVGTALIAEVRGRQLPIKIVKLPFYKK